MGAGFSAYVGESAGDSGCSDPRLDDLPESVLAAVLRFLDPPEICNLARLNRAFYRASLSDFLWESKLPENYRGIAEKVFEARYLECLSSKEIYALLCCPNRFDSGTKEVWMEKRTGGICVGVSWKGMKITGIEDRRYWNRIPTDESRFQTIAYLRQMWWLEVEGNVEFEFPAGTYGLFFRLRTGTLTTVPGGSPTSPSQVHGWNLKPVRFQFSTSDGQRAESLYHLNEHGRWMNYHVGDFVVGNSFEALRVGFSMTQIDCTHPKGGLCLDSAWIRPCGLGDTTQPKIGITKLRLS